MPPGSVTRSSSAENGGPPVLARNCESTREDLRPRRVAGLPVAVDVVGGHSGGARRGDAGFSSRSTSTFGPLGWCARKRVTGAGADPGRAGGTRRAGDRRCQRPGAAGGGAAGGRAPRPGAGGGRRRLQPPGGGHDPAAAPVVPGQAVAVGREIVLSAALAPGPLGLAFGDPVVTVTVDRRLDSTAFKLIVQIVVDDAAFAGLQARFGAALGLTLHGFALTTGAAAARPWPSCSGRSAPCRRVRGPPQSSRTFGRPGSVGGRHRRFRAPVRLAGRQSRERKYQQSHAHMPGESQAHGSLPRCCQCAVCPGLKISYSPAGLVEAACPSRGLKPDPPVNQRTRGDENRNDNRPPRKGHGQRTEAESHGCQDSSPEGQEPDGSRGGDEIGNHTQGVRCHQNGTKPIFQHKGNQNPGKGADPQRDHGPNRNVLAVQNPDPGRESTAPAERIAQARCAGDKGMRRARPRAGDGHGCCRMVGPERFEPPTK